MANNCRTFRPNEAHGGEDPLPSTTALILVDFQNELTTEGGKMYAKTKECMEATNMLDNAVEVFKTNWIYLLCTKKVNF